MKIILGISSGIAAFKVIDLIEILKKNRHEIFVVMTEKASNMISPEKLEELTGNSISINLFDENFSYKNILKTRKVDHIEVAKKADLMVIAPATANTIAKIASGIADDFLTTTLLATKAPVLICPSMNSNMFCNPATQHNLKKIRSYGYEILEPDSGELACGTSGVGRLPDPKQIAKYIEDIFKRSKEMKGKKIIITSGGTQESIDDVRIITNNSSGKMGKAIAEDCFLKGAEVTFIRAKKSAETNLPIKQLLFQTSSDLAEILEKEVKNADIVFHAAAVSDFKIKKYNGKISSKNDVQINLEPSQKIINKIKQWNPDVFLVGFKALFNLDKKEIVKQAKKLIQDAGADLVVVNDISRKDIGFESDKNEVYLVDKNFNIEKIDKASKKEIAKKILEEVIILKAKGLD